MLLSKMLVAIEQSNGGSMETLNALCVKDWEVTAENGDHFKVKRGKFYTASPPTKNGHVTVFGTYWVPVPVEHFSFE